MARVLTNKSALAFSPESSPGVLPGSPQWFRLQPNTIKTFGAVIKSVTREPIDITRQSQPGTIVDLDSSVEFEHDLTTDSITKLMEGFVGAEAVNLNLYFLARPAVASGATYTIPGATTSQAGKLQYGATGPKTLLFAAGYANATNNGLKVLAADTGTSGTVLAVSGTLVDETPPTNAYIALAGIRANTADLQIVVSAGVATITSGHGGGTAIDFTTIGITAGQFIYAKFPLGEGYLRVTSIVAETITGDKLSAALITDTAAGVTVDLYYGRFIRNVDVDQNADDKRYIERTYTFELFLPDAYGVGTHGYQYSPGNYFNSLSFNVPLTSKAVLDCSFIGIDTENPTSTRKTNAATPTMPIGRTAFNTSTNIVNLRTTGLAASDTYFKSLSLKINNNASPEKVLGRLGAAVIDMGRFKVEIQSNVIFAGPDIITNIRNNVTCTMDFLLRNENGAIAVDIPSLKFSGGGRTYPQDKSVLMDITANAHQDDSLGTSIGISLFQYLP